VPHRLPLRQLVGVAHAQRQQHLGVPRVRRVGAHHGGDGLCAGGGRRGAAKEKQPDVVAAVAAVAAGRGAWPAGRGAVAARQFGWRGDVMGVTEGPLRQGGTPTRGSLDEGGLRGPRDLGIGAGMAIRAVLPPTPPGAMRSVGSAASMLRYGLVNSPCFYASPRSCTVLELCFSLNVGGLLV
jgi:hypothetical protein